MTQEGKIAEVSPDYSRTSLLQNTFPIPEEWRQSISYQTHQEPVATRVKDVSQAFSASKVFAERYVRHLIAMTRENVAVASPNTPEPSLSYLPDYSVDSESR